MPEYPRLAAKTVHDMVREHLVVWVLGPRGSGKRSFLVAVTQAVSPLHDLDQAGGWLRAESDPSSIVPADQDTILVGHADRSPRLLQTIADAVNERGSRQWFLLSVRSWQRVPATVLQSLHQLSGEVILWPLAQAEIEDMEPDFIEFVFGEKPPATTGTDPPEQVWSRILTGGYPEAVARDSLGDAHKWLGGHLTQVLERDTGGLNSDGAAQTLVAMCRHLAGHASEPLNVAGMARALELRETTARRYLDLLRELFLAVDLPAWSGPAALRAARSPKTILTDAGMAASLLGVSEDMAAAGSDYSHSLGLTFVAMEILKQMGSSQTRAEFGHFRNAQGAVDLVLSQGEDGPVVGLQVRPAGEDQAALEGLRLLREHLGDRFLRGLVLTHQGPSVLLEDQLVRLSVDVFWTPPCRRPGVLAWVPERDT